MREFDGFGKKVDDAVRKIGVQVEIQTADGIRHGSAAIYPLRQHQVKDKREGRCDMGNFFMFGSEKLLDGVKEKDIVRDENGTVYTIVWVEEYACRTGAYLKAYMKKNRQEKI